MAVELTREILRIYSRYNPVFYAALAKANPRVEPYLHQVEFLARTLLRHPLRVFVADEIGLGKTITAILAMKRLMDNGLAKRVLILVPRVLVKQWVAELERFGIYSERIERSSFEGYVKRGFPEGVYIASMDLAKRSRYANKLAGVAWDLLIVDEAHRLGLPKGRKPTLRYTFAEKVASDKGRNILLLSATPHRGDPQDYLSRMLLLDPNLRKDLAALDNAHFYAYSRNVLIFRRTKVDVNTVYEGRRVFPSCKILAIVVAATQEENEFHSRLIRFLRTKILDYHRKTGTEPRALGLLNALIFKRASSSPYAAVKTMEVILLKRASVLSSRLTSPKDFEKLLSQRQRLARMALGQGFEEYDQEEDPDKVVEDFAELCSAFLSEKDVKELRGLIDLARKCVERDSRLSAVMNLVEQRIRSGEKVILFTEFKDTARYIADTLIKRLGKDQVEVLTSEEARNEEKLSVVRRWLEKPGGRVLVATDVASEGLNLQVANVLVNYEPPWSPVKLEQRIGRVWRLGQARDVTVYTMFLAVESDRDVLNVLYGKLIAMGRALGKLDKPPVGEEARVIDLEQCTQLPPPVVGRRDRVVRVSEYQLRREYLVYGREGFTKLVEAIVRTIQQLQENLEKIGGYARPQKEQIEEFMRRAVGFSNLKEAEEAVANLMVELASHRPDLVQLAGNEYVVRAIGGTPIPLSRTWSALAALLRAFEGGGETFQPIFVVAEGKEEREVRIYEVQMWLKDRALIYSEPVGVDSEGRIVRGAALINLLAEAIRWRLLEAKEFALQDSRSYSIILKNLETELIDHLIKNYKQYCSVLISKHLRSRGDEDLLLRETEYRERLLGVIRFTSPASFASEAELSMEERRKVEEEAMRIAIDFERRQGREAIDVSRSEHYDIYSRNARTSEERYIEVKGHRGPSLMAELTEDEYRVAEKLRSKYWLYIVYNIGSGNPQLIAIQNPLSKMKVSIHGTLRYVLQPGGPSG
ncbi:MAG: helicase-related protein [Thermofilaceae archaeon]